MAPRTLNRLPASYKNLKPGLHCDGGNLHLQITEGPAGNRRLSWIFRYALKGQFVEDENGNRKRQKYRDMGLGSLNDVSLAEAREKAREYRNLTRDGIDPAEHRKAIVAKNLAARAGAMTFDQAAEAYIRQHKAGWKNAAHAAQWKSSLRSYVSPIIGRMSVAEIDTRDVMRVIEPIWLEKPETANRARSRVEAVLGWATASGYRKGDNPARWRNHLDNLLAARRKVRAVRHMGSLPYSEMAGFMAELRKRRGAAALALEFAILTCVRTADVRNARHEDIDRSAKMWIIPHLSKTAAEHKVPLSPTALAVFDKARAIAKEIGGRVGASEFAFPNDITGARLSENAMLAVLARMGRKGKVTTHGCRASFRTWAQEQTNFPRELCEMSLGHRIGSAVEQAYARGDQFKKRIAIMDAWSNFLDRPPTGATVTHIRKAKTG